MASVPTRDLFEADAQDRLAVGEAEVTLPALNGSDKQVHWARNIRRSVLRQRWPWPPLSLLICITDASWWIANKGMAAGRAGKCPVQLQLLGAVWPPGSDAGRGWLAEE